MLGRIRSKLTYANVASTIAMVAALGTGGAYAANTIGSSDIIDESILRQDIKNGEITWDELALNSVTSSRIKDESVNGTDIINGTVATADLADGSVQTAKLADGGVQKPKLADGGVTTPKLADGGVTTAKLADDAVTNAKLAPNSVTSAEIATDAVAATEIQDNSIDAGEIVDFGLTNQDIGVLFAEVSAVGVLDNSSGGGVTVTKLAGTGNYEVDFARNVATCTSVATIGPSGAGSASGEINVADRSGNAEAVFVDTNLSTGAAADLPFRLVLVC